MRTRETNKRRWTLLLVTLPFLLAVTMQPVAARSRQRTRAQQTRHGRQRTRAQVARAATRALQAETVRGVVRPEVIQQLVLRGADVNALAYSGSTAGGSILQSAAFMPLSCDEPGRRDLLLPFSEQERTTLVRFLLAHGADANAHGGGVSPLMWAASALHVGVVRVLLDHGAQVNLRDGNKTALRMARERLDDINRSKELSALPHQAAVPPQVKQEFVVQTNSANRIIAMLTAAGGRE